MTTTTRNIIKELKRAATEQGAGEAVRTIAGPALETWMRALDGKDADPERLDDLATLMTARLSIRDAALIAAVEPKLDTATVIDMAARPHASNNKTLLTETLKAAFDDPHIRPDETRLARAVREACAMADRARKHGGPVAQPYALAAYLAWWDGDGKAATLAALAALRAPIDAFFEDVLIMDDDLALRENRLRLLNRFVAVFAHVADFGKMAKGAK